MRQRGARVALVTMLMAVLWQCSVGAPAAGAFSRTVVFGDSLTDPGNAFILLDHTSARPPFQLVPDAPYARGGHHFSDGPTWVEQLGTELGLDPSPGPAFQRPVIFSNYAIGSSRARERLALQVGRFLLDFGGVAPSDALYVVHIGGDDLQDALAALVTDPSGVTSLAIIGAAVDAIEANMTALVAAGARTFLVANAPDLALIPAVRLAGPAAQAAGTIAAGTFNQLLEAKLIQLELTPGVKAFRLDIFELIHEIVSAPASFGFTDVENPCITVPPSTQPGPFCAHPDEFVFWDGIHPTRAGHGVIAGRALDKLAGP